MLGQHGEYEWTWLQKSVYAPYAHADYPNGAIIMKHLIYLTVLATSLLSGGARAADANGYTAEYECRANGPRCDVDVVSLVSASCDVTVTTNDSNWSKITNDPSKNVYCIQAGNHTGKGTLTLRFSGTSANRKVLRYYRANDNNDEPWNQSVANQVKMPKVAMAGASYWIFHRLTWDGTSAPAINLDKYTNAQNNLFNRLYFTNLNSTPPDSPAAVWAWNGASYTTLQNSVCSKSQVAPRLEIDCYIAENAAFNRFVNNECFNVQKCYFQKGWLEDDNRGSIVENNDIYLTNSYYYNGSGTQDPKGGYSVGKEAISLKRGGTFADPTKVVHNRVWGWRRTDRNACCLSTGEGGAVMITDDGANSAGAPSPESSDYILIKNNIFIDLQTGVGVARSSKDNNSIIGNIFYNINDHVNQSSVALSLYSGTKFEANFNTIISSRSWVAPSVSDSEIRCNIIIDSGKPLSAAGAQTTVQNNAFFNTPVYTTASISGVNISYSAAADSQNTDYCFYRKLRTSPERVCISSALSNVDSPHASACPMDVGDRVAVGVN